MARTMCAPSGIVIRSLIVLLLFCVTSCAFERENRVRSRPRQVTVDVINSTTAEVTWTPPKEEDYSCKVDRYLLRLKEEDAMRSRTWKIDGKQTSLVLQELIPGTLYSIRIVAVMCDGKSPPSRWVQLRTTEPVPLPQTLRGVGQDEETQAPGKPTYVRTRTFTDSVIVSWQPPEEDIIIRGYICGYGEGVPDINWKYVDASKTNVTINNLKASTQYVVSLRAYNNFGKGPVVYDLIYTREESDGLPSDTFTPPIGLKAKILSPNTAWLQWSDPSLGRSQSITDNRYYNVHYQALPNGKTLSVIVKALRVVLYDLVPGTKYEFKVRTVLDANASPFSVSAFNRTFETAPGSAPRNVKVEGVDDSNDVQVHWRSPRQPNGEITGYILFYTQDRDLPDREWHVKALPGSLTAAQLGPLSANTTYYFKLQARNSNGFGPMSDIISYFTTAVTKAPTSSPRNLMVLAGQYPTEVALSWRIPRHINSPINEYVVYFTWSMELNQEEWVVHYVSGTSTETTISGLRPNITYYFRVVPKTTRGEGQTSTTVEYFTKDVEKPTPGPNDPDVVEVDDEGDDAQFSDAHSSSSNSTTIDDYDHVVSGVAERKTKREHGMYDASVDSWDNPQMTFKVKVQFFVSAFISWPEKLTPCDYNTKVIGYTLRYYKQDGGEPNYQIQNLSDNFVVLGNLEPDSHYIYQVKYVLVSGPDSDWSAEETLSTHYTPLK